MGGLGKTDLAKLVRQEVMTTKLFDHDMWICVSDNFNVKRILGEMLQCLSGERLDNQDAIIRKLEKELYEKKFLLVLDDVWEDLFVLGDASDDAFKKWDGLKNRLSTVAKVNGSAIVVTTRSERVASAVETSPQHRHNLNFLSDDDCWRIIKNGVSMNEDASILLSDLEPIGKEIARECRGVPLVARVLGGTMRLHRNKETWLSILNSGVFNASNYVKAALKLSFDNLPSYVKPCFSYCSIFPKDTFIHKEQLILLWMAEGFVEPCNGDEGNKYFNVLLCSSLFQDVERDRHENIISCKMHDLVHDLAMSLSKSEILTWENYSPGDDLTCIRRVNVDGGGVTNSIASLGAKLRTLFSSQDMVFDKSWQLNNLRTLNLAGSTIEELPSSIGEWKLLRYLDISKTQVKELPESITKLYNLQTLRFLNCESLEELPKEKLKNLVSLKHLEFSEEEHMPSGLGRLTGLEKLPLFVVGSDWGGGIDELEELNELSGKLRIGQLEMVIDKEEAKRANLCKKKKINFLKFVWSSSIDREDHKNAEEVLEVLQPHPKIERIEIVDYKGCKFPEWVKIMKVPNELGDSFTLLHNLVELRLDLCKNCGEMPSLGCLQSLKWLYIRHMHRVEYIGNQFYGIDGGGGGMMSSGWRLFPALKSFCLDYISNLVEWRAAEVRERGDAVVFPCLEELSIRSCMKLTKIPIRNLSSLVKLQIKCCDELSYIFVELQSFPSLKSLEIFNCKKINSIPSELQSFASMEELSIKECYSLTSIPEDLGKLTLSLISLQITNCWCLSFFPQEIIGSLTRLKILRVGGFSKELDDFSYLNSIQNLTSLEQLNVYGNDRVKSLPHQLQCLTSQKSLGIHYFYRIEELPEWLDKLSSLQSLEIDCCPKLKKLPTSMKRLSKLRNLWIDFCRSLEHSLMNKSGSEWDKISHISNVKFKSKILCQDED